MNYTHQQPVGVAGLISPWNLPAYLLTFKIAPALAAGCTVVCKPSEMTSMTAYMLAKVMDEVGMSSTRFSLSFYLYYCPLSLPTHLLLSSLLISFLPLLSFPLSYPFPLPSPGLPPGVCNIVFGTGPKAGEAIVTHPQVPVISFTGSTATGKRIQAATAPFVKKLSLEVKLLFLHVPPTHPPLLLSSLYIFSSQLGGKNAGIVFADADLDKCLPVMMRSSFINQGEVCLTTSRIFVEEPIFESFVQRFVEKAK